jgi:ferritin-like metal-binding protein YciE
MVLEGARPCARNNPTNGGSMAAETMNDLYLSELRDLYSSEQQLLKALPKMAKNAESEELSNAINSHLEETKNQVTRLEQIFESLGENPKGKKCVGMEGIIKEGSEALDEFEGAVLDAAMIASAQRVEHYEIAAYGTVCAFAQLLERNDDLGLLKETLEEEKKADEKLTQISETVNQSGMDEFSEENEMEESVEGNGAGERTKSRKEPTRSRRRSAA